MAPPKHEFKRDKKGRFQHHTQVDRSCLASSKRKQVLLALDSDSEDDSPQQVRDYLDILVQQLDIVIRKLDVLMDKLDMVIEKM
ncbi:hypothetical protein GUJ93_ZPchr0002g25334 [Zizania palustris]|uniref:Uncharacterized protein n=1 Tax=Zizania palustris TaxID=103762 RepID=A0A8J5V5F6_ZIZPA|nr:hypothetical protein GUJ93_ZPchr0002g25334 [Zizania palustris]